MHPGQIATRRGLQPEAPKSQARRLAVANGSARKSVDLAPIPARLFDPRDTAREYAHAPCFHCHVNVSAKSDETTVPIRVKVHGATHQPSGARREITARKSMSHARLTG